MNNYYYTHFDRLFREFTGNDYFDSVRQASKESSTVKLPNYPPCDCLVSADRNTLSLRFAMAGYATEDVEVVATNSTISVKAKPQQDTEGEALAYVHSGISKKAIDFTVAIDENYDAKQAETSFKNGMLIMELPIKKEAKSVKLM